MTNRILKKKSSKLLYFYPFLFFPTHCNHITKSLKAHDKIVVSPSCAIILGHFGKTNKRKTFVKIMTKGKRTYKNQKTLEKIHTQMRTNLCEN